MWLPSVCQHFTYPLAISTEYLLCVSLHRECTWHSYVYILKHCTPPFVISHLGIQLNNFTKSTSAHPSTSQRGWSTMLPFFYSFRVVFFSMWCCSRSGGDGCSSVATGSISRLRKRCRSQIIVMDCWDWMGLSLAWVGAIWFHRVQRLIVVANIYSICHSEWGRVGPMEGQFISNRSKKG